MDFVELIIAVHDRLDAAGLPHAFGGALALGYVAEPRGTVDIDVNVFVPVDEFGVIAEAVGPLGYRAPAGAEATSISGIRFDHAVEPFPLDVFPSLDDLYDEIARRVERHPFGRGDDRLPFLSAEDLCIFKLSFGRPQDWVDLRNIAAARPQLDAEYIERQLVALRGQAMYPRLARLRRYLATPPEPRVR
jgi:hypothetical protein